VIRKSVERHPADRNHRSCRATTAEAKQSKSTVHRIPQAIELQPHRQKHFKLSTDPRFVNRVRDVVGLCLDPPDHAKVFAVDEKSQIQASIARSPRFRWAQGMSRGARTTTLASRPPRCSPP
jgi:putative transposase